MKLLIFNFGGQVSKSSYSFQPQKKMQNFLTSLAIRVICLHYIADAKFAANWLETEGGISSSWLAMPGNIKI